MRPHTRIGMIGAVDHGMTTLTAAITSTLANARSAPLVVAPPQEDLRALSMVSAAKHYEPPVMVTDQRHIALPYYPPNYVPPRMRREAVEAPPREKTPEDLERMAAAQRKRDRKAAKKTQ